MIGPRDMAVQSAAGKTARALLLVLVSLLASLLWLVLLVATDFSGATVSVGLLSMIWLLGTDTRRQRARSLRR